MVWMGVRILRKFIFLYKITAAAAAPVPNFTSMRSSRDSEKL
jgi:hypothetical protein